MWNDLLVDDFLQALSLALPRFPSSLNELRGFLDGCEPMLLTLLPDLFGRFDMLSKNNGYTASIQDAYPVVRLCSLIHQANSVVPRSQ